jgi:hypothetical protein
MKIIHPSMGGRGGGGGGLGAKPLKEKLLCKIL